MEGKTINNQIKKVLISEEQIQNRVSELAKEINRDYSGKKIHLVSILKGATIFASDLMRKLEVPVTIDFISVSSYGNSTESSGVVRIIKDLDHPIEGREILLVEDIVDTGLTLKYIQGILLAHKPKSLKTCVFLDKYERRQVDLKIDYTGFIIPNEFVVGYGLDFAERYRNLTFLGILKEDEYT
ncbi:MAG: Hypoxanthine-guanine phosphoribosyltransferase [candidate division WS2 bacterium]|uniref:Hypoxanthine phosphoribosyltransferase n=1 Tax=Psychracetigena formicireducens TaxID=2986056 RepID=A0A9E2BI28_PSYF1|nr:Hypoxanthine-guanine phosphoribosyltransferase [Candidatus Psychracetigena formicireducens]MBT9144966.1 Hypoxanthine-guanine phosphoribosyltransferase [Candidatus Psychracetigena formicireducens]MBT9150683.1 Hypoxanthine-guanine phosphoribosyltransferase [Candidatus Psychracetigena formicireducens]